MRYNPSMSETQPSPEQQQRYDREQVLSALGQLVKDGFTSPDVLPLDDPRVIEAGRIL